MSVHQAPPTQGKIAMATAPGKTPGTSLVSVSGRLDADGAAQLWHPLEAAVTAQNADISLDLSRVDYCDGAGTALLLHLSYIAQQAKNRLEMTGLKPEFAALLDMFSVSDITGLSRPKHRHLDLASEVGKAATMVWADIRQLVGFIGEYWSATFHLILRPRDLRLKDALRVAETAGANATPIIVMIGFLMGLITAFQSAMPLRQFGAEIFVANLLGLSMLRELGPLVTAIIMSGRSGSAFAAELGTMKVNEEINALQTMGLDPVRFLVIPRVTAAMAMMPLLTMIFNFFALVGGGVVMVSLGYPVVTYCKQVVASVTMTDMVGGLFKAVVFSHLVCGIGCLRGLQTSGGPSAVGDSATSAVVSGIILVAVFDGIFAVVFYALKL